ncbi:Hsp20/alpha crystallin family protein [uncultured Photobacterium sp.]|uniref:Hsp20/alpha crystallin family protein n=1 Tax=uncultured Photobacterium sp. TaxID=173973 RepID=UPI00261CBACA|nr:Hsp20/alpha crystallin family protein [uncultured Photobacterium sp.]
MSLIPRDSWFDFNQMFENAFPALRHTFDIETLSPRIDIIEKENCYQITADLPGVKKEDITVQINNGNLSIEASTSKSEEHKEGDRVLRKERYEGKLMRNFYLGHNLKQDDIHASFTDGVLRVEVPKAEPTPPASKQIEIK